MFLLFEMFEKFLFEGFEMFEKFLLF